MASKYIDTSAVIQVIGCVFNKPDILERTDKYTITDTDFVEQLHLIVFGAIYNLWENGAKEINLNVVEDYLAQHPKARATYEKEKGSEWLTKVADSANEATFDYYYNRLKKFTLLREFDKIGVDVSWVYDPDNILDTKKKEIQEEWIDSNSLAEISQKITGKIDEIVSTCVDNTFGEMNSPGQGLEELKESLKLHPDVGIPLWGKLTNTVCRGARLGKFYLASYPSGMGKTRAMIGNICYIGCSQLYSTETGDWTIQGSNEPAMYITTEQDLSEVQTMMLAFISAVNEEHILNNTYQGDEEQRVDKAIKILKQSKISVVELPDFNLKDVENLIKRGIREKGIKYIGFDYIMSSLSILAEIAGRAGGVKIREDNILFMMSRRLKDIATEYGVFVLSSTQLSGNWRESQTPDQNLLRGAKSLADSIDYGTIGLPVSEEDIKSLESILGSHKFDVPNLKISIYKNRRGRYKGVYLWVKADYGTCRFDPMFMTDWSYNYVPVEDLKIEVRSN